MKKAPFRLLTLLSSIVMAALTAMPVQAATVTVSGTADPWLAGMPNGSTASGSDTAPAQSPALLSGVTLISGNSLIFTVSGFVGYSPGRSSPPDGGGLIGPHLDGAQNGISALTAPHESLIGVFLDSSQPNGSAAPAGLDFTSLASRNYLSLAPLLRQTFFIGDGLTTDGIRQQVVIPNGATRLFLGSMDGFAWNNNVGSFSAIINSVPEPPPFALVAVFGAVFWHRSRDLKAAT